VKAISGVHTVRFKNELERNITIKLGYANAKVHSFFPSPSLLYEKCTHEGLVECRFTSVRTQVVRDLEVTNLIVQIKKIIHLVKTLVVVVL